MHPLHLAERTLPAWLASWGAVVLVLTGCGAAISQSTRPAATASAADTADPTAASTVHPVADGEPWIAYQWLAGTGDGIFLVRPDGSDGHQLVPVMPGSEIHPDWSPDGSRIAFVNITPTAENQLWVVNADGTDPELLFACTAPCNQVVYPDWAPDGSAIYFTQDANVPAGGGPPTTFMIGRYDLASGQAGAVLTREDGMTIDQPRVSPDGSQIAFVRFRDVFDDLAGSAVFVMDLDGGAETQLTDWDMFAAYPDWTPDGRIVFNTYDLGIFQDTTEAANLYVIGPDGSGLEVLTRFAAGGDRATQPRVAPDGSGVAFTLVQGSGFGTRRLAFLEFGASEAGWLTTAPMAGTHPMLRPLPD